MSKKEEYQNKFELTQLGCVFGLFFLIIHLLADRNDNILLFVSSGFLGISIFFKIMLVPLNTFWRWLGGFLGTIIAPVILGVFYFGFLFPLAVLRKIFSSEGIETGFKTKDESYWNTREDSIVKPADIEHQF